MGCFSETKSNDKEEAEEKQQDKKKKAIESKAVTQSTEEATQTQEITKTKIQRVLTNPEERFSKTTAKSQSQMEAQNRKRKNTNAQGGSAPKRVQSTKEKRSIPENDTSVTTEDKKKKRKFILIENDHFLQLCNMPYNEWTNDNKRSIMFDILKEEDPNFTWPLKIPADVLNWEYDNRRNSAKKNRLKYNEELATNKKAKNFFGRGR